MPEPGGAGRAGNGDPTAPSPPPPAPSPHHPHPLSPQPAPERPPHLGCSYETNGSPYLLLQPAKKETLRLRPYVALYHDFVSDAEAETIKGLAGPWVSPGGGWGDGDEVPLLEEDPQEVVARGPP